MYQIETLFTNSWIAIDRSKRGPSNHKAFLTKQGIRILSSIRKDFEILLYYKSKESFIFTPQYSDKPLEREVFNREINNFIKSASKKLDNEPLLTSQSFRIGYISKLWKDTEDIEFVRQVIGHVTVQSTSSYVKHFSDKEIEERMAQVKSVDDLIN
jgi:integrase